MKVFLTLLVVSLASAHGIEKRSPQFNQANQQTQAFGGAASTVIASGQANAGLGGYRGGYGGGLGGGYPGGGYQGGYGGGYRGGYGGGYGGGINSASQHTFASGGAGSVVVADGTANAGLGGGRVRRHSMPYDPYGFGRTNIANQQTVGVGGDFSTVIASGTANAGRTKRAVGEQLIVAAPPVGNNKLVVANGVVSV